jgi:capsular exopolysaccharide synthesis family protein
MVSTGAEVRPYLFDTSKVPRITSQRGSTAMVTMNRHIVENAAGPEVEPADTTPADLAGYIAPLKRRWWLLVVIPVVLALMAYELAALRPLSYSATATLLINPVTGTTGTPADQITAATLLTKTYSGFVTSPAILQRVASDLKLPETPTQLESLVTATADPSAQVIRISTKYHSAQGAADITNAVADRFIAFLAEMPKGGGAQASQALNDSINKARSDRDNVAAQLATLHASPNIPTPEDNARIASLDSLLQQYQSTYNGLLDLQQRLNVNQLTSQNNVSLIVRAAPPQQPAGSLRLLATAAALLAGFGATVVGIVVAEQASPRVRSRKDVWRVADIPVLVTAPRTGRKGAIEVIDAPRSAMSEAIYALQTQIWIEARGNAATTVTLTSAGAGEGTSVIAANLATAFAQEGKRVVLVDGNLRAPSLWKLFQKDAKHPGLAELVGLPALRSHEVLTDGPVPGLQLLLAGPVSVIPSERLTSERIERILADLRDRADLVIIDAPPPLADSNTLLFAMNADHTVIVARAGRTRTNALRMAVASIRAVHAYLLGLVLYGADRDGASV